MRRTALLLALIILAGLAAASSASAAPPTGKVTICHKPGTPAEQTITVALAAVAAHAGHGDDSGECGTDPGGGTEPGGGNTPTDACTAINSGSFTNLLFQGDEVILVTLDFTGSSGHVAWFDVCNADGCALIMPRVNWQGHDEFGFPWRAGGLWEDGTITIGLEVQPEPQTISITCSHE